MRALVAAIAAASFFPASLFAGLNSWTSTGPAEPWIETLAIAPSDPRVLYGVTASRRLFASENAGQSWETRGPQPIKGVLVHPSNASTLFGYTGNDILRSVDGGRSWQQISALPDLIESLALAPSDSSVLYAGVAGAVANVFKSTDGAASWRPTNLRAQFGQTGARALVVSREDASVVYAAAYVLDPVLLARGLGILRTVDGGTTWTSALIEGVSPASLPLSLRWVAVDPSRPEIVFAGGFGNVIHRSKDDGRSFLPVTLEASVGVVTSLAVQPTRSSRVYAATSQRGILASDDGGFTFTSLSCGLPHLTMTAIVVSRDGLVLHAGTRWGGVYDYEFTSLPVTTLCSEHEAVACMQAGRFCVRVILGRLSDGRIIEAHAVTVTSNTASFWFFDASNLELMVKVLDGRPINGRFWVFYGSLSNVQYQIQVTDHETGRVKTYTNPQGHVESVTDTEAF